MVIRMEEKVIAENWSDIDHNGKRNFVWYLRKYFNDGGKSDPIKTGWDPETVKKYISNYENIIIPAMSETDFGLTDLSLFTRDDLEAVLFIIGEKRILQGEDQYDEEYMNHFRFIIWRVYKAGFENGHYDDQLGFERIKLFGKGTDKISKARMEILKKSLTLEEEERIAEWFKTELNPEVSDGELYGLLLMYCLGLRNAEACGLTFMNISKIQSRDYSCAFITTTLDDKGRRKVGGKTDNMPRIIPVYDFLRDIIQARKEAIVRKLSSDGIPSPEQVVEKYPIACKKLEFEKNAISRDLTKAGGELLNKLCDKDFDLRSELVSQQLFRERLKDELVDEKDSTTYLFRRNFATGLYGLGFSINQCQYLMGHLFEGNNDLREYYTNTDRQDELRRLFDHHPIKLFFGESVDRIKVQIKHSTKKKTVHFDVHSKEPNADIKLRLIGSSPGPVNAKLSKGFLPEYANTVDVRTKIVKASKQIIKSKQP